MQEQVDVQGMQLRQEADKILQAAAQPIYRPRHHHVELAAEPHPEAADQTKSKCRRASGHLQIGWPRRDQSTHKCGSPLGFDLNRSPWLRWQLENGGFLTFSQTCQEYNLAVWKLQCIVMGGGLSLLICRKMAVVCSIVRLCHGHTRADRR